MVNVYKASPLCLYLSYSVREDVEPPGGQDNQMQMFTRMLRRQGFYRVKGATEPVFMKHNVGIGGVYVRLDKKTAFVTVRDLGIDQEFTKVKQLETFISGLDEEAYRQRCFIVNKMRGAGS